MIDTGAEASGANAVRPDGELAADNAAQVADFLRLVAETEAGQARNRPV